MLFTLSGVFAAVLASTVLAAPLPNSTAIRKDDGRGSWTVGLDERGNSLFLEIRGQVEFEWADVRFDDGDQRRIDLHQATRGDGLYLLVDFTRDRDVASVTFSGRARDDVSYVGLRLGRNAPGD